jgi:L-cysteine/cystine lyase
MPIKEIAAIAHERRVPVLVDGAQSGGHIDVNVKDLGVDYYSVSGQKWLMGPAGTGALYVQHGKQAALEPAFVTNAIADARPFQRAPLARFPLTSQNPGLLAGFGEAVRLAIEAGIPAIEERTRLLGAFLVKVLGAVPSCTILSPTDPRTSCGLTTIALEGWEPSVLVSELQERYRVVARTVNNPAGVRFSTHYFNNEDEINHAVLALKTLATQGPPKR